MASVRPLQSGDIVISVYLGGMMLDEVIVNAQQGANLRSYKGLRNVSFTVKEL